MLGFRSKERALRKDRDRYVGFAFAAAETLIELDRDRTVRTVAGANPLGDGAKLLERCFTDVLNPGERAVMAAALACTAAGGRLPQTVVHLDHPTHGSRPHVVSGWCLPDLDRHFFLALRPLDAPIVDAGEAAESETGLLVPTAFKDSVAASDSTLEVVAAH